MYCDIPECKRCCFCIPLRHGIIIFGYLNLIFTVLALTMTSYHFSKIDKESEYSSTVMGVYHGLIVIYHIALPLTLYSIDVIFNIILLVGAHMKKDIILKVYFWYGIATTASTIVAFFAKLDYIRLVYFEDLIVMFSGLVVHVYLILLIWWEIKKLYNVDKYRFVNRTTTLQEMMDSTVQQEPASENV